MTLQTEDVTRKQLSSGREKFFGKANVQEEREKAEAKLFSLCKVEGGGTDVAKIELSGVECVLITSI